MAFLLFEVYNFVYLLGVILIYYATRIHFRIFTGSSIITGEKWWKEWQIIIIGLIFGIFLPVLTGITVVFVVGAFFTIVRKSPKKPTNEQNKVVKKIPKIAFIWYWGGIFLGVVLEIALVSLFMVGVIGRWMSLDYYYPISFTIGLFGAAFFQIYFHKSQPLPRLDEKHKLVFKRTKMLAMTFAVFFAFSNIWITISQSPPTPPENLSDYFTVRAVTFNILNMNSNKFESVNYWENRRIQVTTHLSQLNPDFFGVQEAYFEQSQYLNSSLSNRKYTWSGLGRDDGVIAGEFSAIFFDMDKFQLLDAGTFWLSDTPDIPSRFPEDHQRICSWIHLQLKEDGSEFFVFNTHYGFSPELQIKSSILLNQRVVNMTGDLPVIIMGDFNMMNIYPFYLFMEGYGTKPLQEAYRLTHGYVNPLDATSAPTFKIATDVGFHIDQFFVSSTVVPTSVRTIKESYDGIHTYSDHYPVQMDCLILRTK